MACYLTQHCQYAFSYIFKHAFSGLLHDRLIYPYTSQSGMWEHQSHVQLFLKLMLILMQVSYLKVGAASRLSAS